MSQLRTTYDHALAGFQNYEKGLRGKVSLKEMRELNRGFRKIYNELLLDVEKTIQDNYKALTQKFSSLPKDSADAKTELINNHNVEARDLQRETEEIELTSAELDAMIKAINDVQFKEEGEKTEKISGVTLVLLDEFLEHLEEANKIKQ